MSGGGDRIFRAIQPNDLISCCYSFSDSGDRD